MIFGNLHPRDIIKVNPPMGREPPCHQKKSSLDKMMANQGAMTGRKTHPDFSIYSLRSYTKHLNFGSVMAQLFLYLRVFLA